MSRFTSLHALLTRGLSRLDPAVLLLVRFTLGVVFLQSGWGKLHNLEKVTAYFAELGLPAPALQAPLVAGCELVFGSLVLAGALTRLASLPLVVMMVVAIVTARRGDVAGVGDVLGLIEYLYLVLALTLAARGAGPWSVDYFIARGRPPEGGDVAAGTRDLSFHRR
jgi:putative oxidoreductase